MALLMAGGLVQPVGLAVSTVAAAIPPSAVPAPAGGTISGQVTDDRGAPVSGARIQYQRFSQSVLTGPDGRYLIAGLTDGSYRVSVDTGIPKPPTFSTVISYPELITVTSLVGQAGVDFELPRPAIVSGIVRSDAGIPVVNAQISGLRLFPNVTTGPDGRYLVGVEPGPRTISAGAEGFIGGFSPGNPSGANSTPIDPAAGQVTTVDFVLDAGGALSGRIRNADGSPAAGAFVSTYTVAAGIGDYTASTNADSTGFYRLSGLIPGDYVVSTPAMQTSSVPRVYFPGTTDVGAAVPVSVVDGTTTPSIDFDLPAPVAPGPPITVTSISPPTFRRGTTAAATLIGTGFVPGATVTIDTFGPPPQPDISVVEVVDSEHVLVNVTTPVDAPLGAEGGLFVGQLGQIADCFCGPFVTTESSTFGTISGLVTQASGGAPAANIQVSAQPVGGGASEGRSATVTAADGSYQLGPLQAGDYTVKFSTAFALSALVSEYYLDVKNDVAPTAVTVLADADTSSIDAVLETRVDVASITSVTPALLVPGTTAELTVIGTGLGIGDFFSVVTTGSVQPPPSIVAKRVVSSTEVLLTVAVDALTPSGPASLSLFPQGGGGGSACNCLSIGTVPESTGTISGAVTEPLGEGLASVRVSAVADGQSEASGSGWTGVDGTYALRLPAGTYSLHFEDLAGAVGGLAAVTVTVGQYTAGVNVTVAPLASIGALSGSVTDSLGQGLPGALVRATNSSTGEGAATLTGNLGSYRLPTLSAGDYLVEFSAPGYQTRWHSDAMDVGTATPVTVASGSELTGINGSLPLSRRPLSLTAVAPGRVELGESIQAAIAGSGFSFGDVSNLSFSAGDGVTITPLDTSLDSTATVSIDVDPSASLGPRDVVAVRDDGQQVSCSGCLKIYTSLGSISGAVASANGAPLQLATISATSLVTGEVFPTQAGAGGGYLLDRLPLDDYRVVFASQGFVTQWYNDADSAATATPVIVAASPITGIDAILQPARKFLFVNSANPTFLQQGTTTSVTLFGGGFLDGGVTGLLFDAGPDVTVQVDSVLSDSSALATITVAPDSAPGPVGLAVTRDDGSTSVCTFCVQVTEARGRITGRVTGSGGAILSFATVLAYPVGGTFPVAGAPVQPDSTYSIDNLPPGDYQLQFQSFPYDPQWWQDVATQAEASTISVAGGQTITDIDAELSIASRPLRLDPGFPGHQVVSGSTTSAVLFGDGFQTGVTGLTFSAGPGISIVVDAVFGDTQANVTITTDPSADVGFRDLVVTRDDGQSATCSLCLDVVAPPPGEIIGIASDAETGGGIFGTVTVTRVGDSTPTQSQFFFITFDISGLAPAEYDVVIEASGYDTFTTRVTVASGVPTFLTDIRVQPMRQPLTFAGPSPLTAYQGFAQQFVVTGSGFRSGGVAGLSFSAGLGVAITVDSVLTDSSAQITVVTASDAGAGARDLTVTRDDGQLVVCTACLIVGPPAPGSISGTVYSSDSFSLIPVTITATLVGESAPTLTASVNGPFTLNGLTPGSYDLLFESPGFISSTQRITVQPGQDTMTFAYLDLPRQPLTISSVSPSTLNLGAFETLQVTGSGFRAGGVTGLAASIGDAVVVQGVSVNSDSLAFVFVVVPQDAAVGAYDLVMTRDPGESAACTGCIVVREAPGFITGFITDAECCGAVEATVTATRVGETVPTATTAAVGFYGLQVPAGDYIVKVEANGYLTQWWDHAAAATAATTVHVDAGAFQTGIGFALTPDRNPFTIEYVSPADVQQGQSQAAFIVGTGFLRGGVTGLTFSAGKGVTVTIDAVFDDQFAQVTITAADNAAIGPRSVVAKRDVGQIVSCVRCLTVTRGQPIVTKVSPSTVREGKRTVTISGLRLQRVIKVTSSSRRVDVESFKNKSDGTIGVQIRIDGGGRRTYTLTFTRDDGSTFTADFSVVR